MKEESKHVSLLFQEGTQYFASAPAPPSSFSSSSLLRLLFLSSALESDSMSSTPNLEPIRQALGPYVKLLDLCTVYLEPRLRLYKLARTLCGAKGPDPVPSLEKTR